MAGSLLPQETSFLAFPLCSSFPAQIASQSTCPSTQFSRIGTMWKEIRGRLELNELQGRGGQKL